MFNLNHPINMNKIANKARQVFVRSKDIKFFIIDLKGKVLSSGDPTEETYSTWNKTHFNLHTIKVGVCPELTLNKQEGNVFTRLNYPITKIQNVLWQRK